MDVQLHPIERSPPKRQFVRILLSPKIEYLLYKPPYLTGIEGPPPKRNVVSSSLAGGAKNDRCKPFFDGLQRFFCYRFARAFLLLHRNDFIHFPLYAC